MSFTIDEKCQIFDKIFDQYFNKNFGSMTKSDFETLLFSEYIEHCIKNGIAVDDYSLSKSLGITQTRIRTLKERKELKYPYTCQEWKNEFAKAVKNAKYDPQTRHIKMIIQDVSVMNEVRNFIEINGWYDECSLNKKLLSISLDCFVEICYESTAFENVFSDELKQQVEKLSSIEDDNTIKTFISDFSKEGLKTFLMKSSKEIMPEVLKLLPFGGVAKTAFDFLSNAIEKTK